MLNVLLVDDEPLALSHMRRLIDWNRHGFRICGEARSGQEALEMIGLQAPHIVIADIHMSGMDGVELSRRIRERYKERIKLIMVSSFDDYDFVRGTMLNGASDYVLKHRIEADGWLELLHRLREEIGRSEGEPDRPNFFDRNGRVLGTEFEQSLLRSIVLGLEFDRTSAEDYFRRLSPRGGGRLVVSALQLSDPRGNPDRYPAEARRLRSRAVLDLVKQGMGEEEAGIAAFVENERYLLLFPFGNERSEYAIYQRVRACLDRITDMLKLYMNLQASYGIGPLGTGLDRLAADYLSASESAAGGHIWPSDAHADRPAAGITLRQEKALISAAEQTGAAAAGAIIDDIFATLREPDTERSLAQCVNELIQLADKIWHKSGYPEANYYEGEWPLRSELSDPRRLDATAEWTKSLYAQLIGKLEAKRQPCAYSVHVEQAIRFVRTRYAEAISLEWAAERIGITDSYLGRLFRQETGTYFTDYLNRVRVEAAKQLMQSGSYRVKQIYDRVGFTNYSYFFKVFKQIEGVTPQAYARSAEEDG